MEWHSQFGFGSFCSTYCWWDSSVLLHLSLVCYFELLSSSIFNSFWSRMRTKSSASLKAVGKESTYNAGDSSLKICWRRDRLPNLVFLGFPGSSAGKESTCSAGDLGSIPGLGRSPGEGKGYPLQYSGLENSMDCIVHGVANRIA